MSLDLDDTLWPMGPVIVTAERVLLAWLTTHCPLAMVGHDIDSMRLLRAHSAAEFPARVHDMTFLRRHALARQITAAGYPESMADEALQVFMVERNRVELYADVLPALSRLRLRYRLFALSNGNADLRRCGIDALFDGHVNAIDAGVGKPDARIFAHLSRLAGVDPIDIVHVGDDPLADVIGATRAGMQAVWLNRDARPWPAQFAPPRRTVATLAELC